MIVTTFDTATAQYRAVDTEHPTRVVYAHDPDDAAELCRDFVVTLERMFGLAE